MRISLKDVAERAGVSVTTVANALKGKGRMADKRREEIRELAQEMGYRPDPALSALQTYISAKRKRVDGYKVGFLTVDVPNREKGEALQSWRRFHYYEDIFAGAAAMARERGYELEEIPFNELPTRGWDRALRERGVRGALLGPYAPGASFLRASLDELYVAQIGFTVRHPRIDQVGPDFPSNISIIWHHLRHLGYKRIALSLPANSLARAGRQMTPMHLFEQQWSARYMGYDILPVLEDESPEAVGQYVREHRPDCFIGYLKTRSSLLEQGLSIPGDIGFVQLIVHPESDLSGLLANGERIGREAMLMVDEALRHNRLGVPAAAQVRVIAGQWHAGSSLRPQR